MRNVSVDLQEIIVKNQCTPTSAFLFLMGENNELYPIQSKSKEKTGRRLRNTSNFKSDGQTLG